MNKLGIRDVKDQRNRSQHHQSQALQPHNQNTQINAENEKVGTTKRSFQPDDTTPEQENRIPRIS